jgi:formamidopyrimidine-DNA glycosylase
MPELPEVEVIKQGIAPRIIDRRVVNIKWANKKLRQPIPGEKLKCWIQGYIIKKIFRRAKYIICQMSNNAHLIIHLGMTGKITTPPPSISKGNHDHVQFFLSGEVEMRYNDIRRFGLIKVLSPDQELESFFEKSGPEPFWDSFSAQYLTDLAKNRNRQVKSFLMDNSIVVGIGNIYANEVLFETAVNPQTPIKRITFSQWQLIVDSSKKILSEAIKRGGTTISDFVNSDGKGGYFQLDLKVYGRSGKPCKICSSTIKKMNISGRASFFCPVCQK